MERTNPETFNPQTASEYSNTEQPPSIHEVKKPRESLFVLSPKEENELAANGQYEKLIEANIRSVQQLVRTRFTRVELATGVSLEDIEGEELLILTEAAHK